MALACSEGQTGVNLGLGDRQGRLTKQGTRPPPGKVARSQKERTKESSSQKRAQHHARGIRIAFAFFPWPKLIFCSTFYRETNMA